MRLAQEGDNIIYERLLEEITPMLRGFFRKFAYSSKVDVDELVQETLIAIHQAGHTYNSERSFKNWFFAIANYKLKDCLRSIYRKRKLMEIDFADVQHALSEDPVMDNDDMSLEEMLHVLSPKQQKIVYSLKIKGNSLQETANELDMSVAAVKVAAHRAYKTLIKKYRPQ